MISKIGHEIASREETLRSRRLHTHPPAWREALPGDLLIDWPGYGAVTVIGMRAMITP